MSNEWDREVTEGEGFEPSERSGATLSTVINRVPFNHSVIPPGAGTLSTSAPPFYTVQE